MSKGALFFWYLKTLHFFNTGGLKKLPLLPLVADKNVGLFFYNKPGLTNYKQNMTYRGYIRI